MVKKILVSSKAPEDQVDTVSSQPVAPVLSDPNEKPVPQNSMETAKVLPEIPVVIQSSNVNLDDLFEKAYIMATSESASFGQNIQTYQDSVFCIRVIEYPSYQVVCIDLNKYSAEYVLEKSFTVFYARRSISTTNQNNKLRTGFYRDGKWASYLANTLYPKYHASHLGTHDDWAVDYDLIDSKLKELK